MFVYALTQPIDFFDGLVPLPRWIADDPHDNTAWALRATLALADAAAEVRWRGDLRHLPSVGALPTPDTAELFMVFKQDTGGTCFVVSQTPIDWLLEYCDQHAEVRSRDIGAWQHTIRSDLRTHPSAEPITVPGNSDETPF
jgi:hypothetical protein